MSAVSSSLAAVEPSDATPPVDGSRHALFRYLTADETADYLAIMDAISATLLTDLSAAEVAAQLAERGLAIGRDVAEARCRQLVTWGNLVPSVRDAKVSTVAEYIRSRSRYQVSKLGGRVHREAVAILHASDGAREVARELLGQIVQSLDRILAMLDPGEPDPASRTAREARRDRRRRAGRRGDHGVRQPAPVHRQHPGLLRLPGRHPQPLRPRRRGVRAVQGAAAGLHRPDHGRRQPACPRGLAPDRAGAEADRPAAGDAGPAARAHAAGRHARRAGPGPDPLRTGRSWPTGTTRTARRGRSSCGRPRGRRSAS